MEEDSFEEPILDLERRIEAQSGVGDDAGSREQRESLQQQLEARLGEETLADFLQKGEDKPA